MKKYNFLFIMITFCSAVIGQNNNVGIGTTNPHPSAILELSSNTKGLKIPTVNVPLSVSNPVEGLLVFSDSDKKIFIFTNGQWTPYLSTLNISENQIPSLGSSGFLQPSGIISHPTAGLNLRSMIIKNDIKVGITNDNALNFIPQELFHVNGKSRTNELQIVSGAANGRVLQSDANGNASWVPSTTLELTETDPRITMSTVNIVPKWNGSTLTDGSIKDSLGQVMMNSLKTTSAKINSLIIPTGWVPNGILWSNSSDGSVQWRDFNTLEADPQVGSQTNSFVPRWNGTSLVDGSIRDFGSNGIGGIEVQGDIITQRLKMTENAATGRILVSENGSGNALWANIENLEKDPKINMVPADIAKTVRWDGQKLQPGSMLDNGNGVQITETVPNSSTPILNVTGLLSTTRFQIPTGAANNRVLKSDINGVGTWAPESDPKVNVLNNRRVARWNGTVLTDGVIQDDGQDVGIFTAPVFGQKLTVNGKTTTTNLQLTTGASNGFLLSSDNQGNATWVNPNTITTSEADPQVSNVLIHAIPRWNGSTLVDGSIKDDATNVGIGTAPVVNQKITVDGKTTTTNFQMTTGAGNNKIIRSDADGNATWVTPSSIEEDPQVNMTNTNYFAFWNGSALVDGIMGKSFSGNTVVVDGNVEADTVVSSRIKMSTGAGVGKTLESDAAGNAAWVPSKVSLSVTNTVPRWSGTTLADGTIQDDATNVGIGTAPVVNQKLTVGGKTTTTNLQMTSGAANGLVLQSDASGNGSWVTSTSLAVNETDPKIASSTTSRIPRWSGTSLADGTIQDDATNVGIGTAPVVNQKLTVGGKTTTTNLQMTSGAANGRVLQSDASGNATWVASTTWQSLNQTLRWHPQQPAESQDGAEQYLPMVSSRMMPPM